MNEPVELTPEQWIEFQRLEIDTQVILARIATARRFFLTGRGEDPDGYEDMLRPTPNGRMAYFPKNGKQAEES